MTTSLPVSTPLDKLSQRKQKNSVCSGFCRKSHTFRGKTLSQGCFAVLPVYAHAASQSRSQMDMYCLLSSFVSTACPGRRMGTEEGVSHGTTPTLRQCQEIFFSMRKKSTQKILNGATVRPDFPFSQQKI